MVVFVRAKWSASRGRTEGLVSAPLVDMLNLGDAEFHARLRPHLSPILNIDWIRVFISVD